MPTQVAWSDLRYEIRRIRQSSSLVQSSNWAPPRVVRMLLAVVVVVVLLLMLLLRYEIPGISIQQQQQ